MNKRRKSAATGRLRMTAFLAAAAVCAVLWLCLRSCGGEKTTEEEQTSVSEEASVSEETFVPDAQVAAALVTVTPDPALVEALPQVDVTSWELQLVNASNRIDASYVPTLALVENNEYVDERVAPQLSALIQAARDCGFTVYLCSGYRSYDTQSTIYWNHINTYLSRGYSEEDATIETMLAVNPPGGSEHQTGLCADVLEYQGQDMEPYIGGEGLMLWLELNCADYGFIIRYPDGKTDITGVEYEPWHLRYVGQTAASYIMTHDLCLEEFLSLY